MPGDRNVAMKEIIYALLELKVQHGKTMIIQFESEPYLAYWAETKN